jgi:N-acyl-D-amino-acid deacylase
MRRFLSLSILLSLCVPRLFAADYDVIIRNGLIHDGSGKAPQRGSIAIKGDKIAAIGELEGARGKREIDAGGLAVAPGFINMLSWATESLIADGRSQSGIRQGVTLEVMGEGDSMGPLTEEMKRRAVEQQGDIRYDITWTTLAEYLAFLEKKGVSTNVASYIGAATIREHVVGLDDRKATPEENSGSTKYVSAALSRTFGRRHGPGQGRPPRGPDPRGRHAGGRRPTEREPCTGEELLAHPVGCKRQQHPADGAASG